MVIFLIVSTLISAIATGIIVFGGLQRPQQRTSTQGQASILKPTPTPSPKPTPLITISPTIKPIVSPSPTPIRVIISPYTTATASSDKRSLFLNFASLGDAKSALYKVTYLADGGEKAASGNVVFQPSQQSATREIILGVCSGSNCTYDTNIKGMKIEVKFTLKDGATSQINYPFTL